MKTENSLKVTVIKTSTEQSFKLPCYCPCLNSLISPLITFTLLTLNTLLSTGFSKIF